MFFDDAKTIWMNSHRSFHSNNVDYICLHRSPFLTVKVYFMKRGDQAAVVAPHDHRYSFRNYILEGQVRDETFKIGRGRHTHNRYAWRSPLIEDHSHQPQGPSPWGRAELLHANSRWASAGDYYDRHASEIHTLILESDEVVILQYQFGPSGYHGAGKMVQATQLFVPIRQSPPITHGLYQPWNPEEFGVVMEKVHRLMNYRFSKHFPFSDEMKAH